MTGTTASTEERLGSLSRDRRELLKLLREEGSRRSRTINPFPRPGGAGAVRLPTSWAQRRLWFIDQLEHGSAGYHVPLAIRLTGTLDQDALQKALDTLVARHEALRTVFVNVDGEPVQEVAPPGGRFELTVTDLTDLAEQDREEAIRVHRIEEVQGKFDLSTGPLIRARLLRLRADEHVLLISMHHIIIDGWSIRVLIRELVELYAACREGREAALEALPIRYADYAQWQRQQWAAGGSWNKQLGYWKTRLAGAAPQLDLPTDRPRPLAQSYRGENVPVCLDAEISARLRAFAQQYEMTLFMVLYAGWAILLSRLSGQQDIVSGSPIANRQRPEVEGLIGLFVNSMALRVEVRRDQTVAEVLRQVKEVTLGAYDHQDVPFEKVVEALRPERSLSRSPLFQVMFVLQNTPKSELNLPGLIAKMEAAADEPSILDLWLALEERGDEIIGSVNYASDLFDRDTIERWMECFTVLLRNLTTDVRTRVGEVPMLSERQRHQVTDIFNATQAPYPDAVSTHALFEERVAQAPDAIAIVCDGESLTYAELNARANQLAHHLQRCGVRPREYVAVLMARSSQMLIAQLAVLKCGGAYVPIDPALPLDRQCLLIRDCGASRIVAGGGCPPGIALENAEWIDCVAAREQVDSSSRENLGLHVPAEAPAYVMYTSGSTGIPKGVIVPHRAINRLIINNGYAQIAPGDCLVHYSNPAFDASTFEIWGALLCGARLLILPQSVVLDPHTFVDALTQHRVSILWMTIGLFIQYTEVLTPVFRQLRYVIVGGDVVDPGILRRVLRKDAPQHLLNAYGPTECTTFSTTHLVRAVEDHVTSIPIGRPIANAQIYILDERLQPVPIGVAGEIHIGGEGVALGYLNRPELTAERFIPNPFSSEPAARLYKSGDLGRWRADGTIDFLGRNDLQVKLRGFRIELGEIESHLSNHPHVKEAAVIARQTASADKRLIAYVVAELPRLKALQEEQTGTVGAEIVDQWKTLYEDTYSTDVQAPSFVGWNSSYSREPIPEAQMQEWLETTLERIRGLNPQNVLEIGCGVGLLLQHLAPNRRSYYGTDFSAEALSRLRRWAATRPELAHIQLEQCAAREMRAPAGAFDTIVLNSVVQYFPDIEYLRTVIERALGWLAPGGHLFIGDVRDLHLLEMFHSSVQLERATPEVTARDLRNRIARVIERDKELVIDPRFFEALSHEIAGVSEARVLLKRGLADNELTRYRYDVILRAGTPRTLGPCERIQWIPGCDFVADVSAILRDRRPSALRVCGIPNRRIGSDLAARHLVSRSEPSSSVAQLKEALRSLAPTGEEPETIWRLARTHGYDVRATAHSDEEGRFDVELIDWNRASSEGLLRVTPGELARGSSVRSSQRAYANDPLGRALLEQLRAQLREHLKRRLPAYMVPGEYLFLESLPLTPNGKLDREALPAPTTNSSEDREYEAPRGELEDAVAGIWQDLLRIERVGRHDNWFELGGHSLLIVQMLDRLRKIGLSAQVRNVYSSPTLADLAQTLTVNNAGTATVPPNLIPPDCALITPQMLPLIQLEPAHIERIARAVPGGARNIQDIYPLTPLQEGMLFHNLVSEHGGDAYARARLLALPSQAHLDKFVRGMQEVIDRHDILRTAVLWEHLPQPVQVVYRRAPLQIEDIVLDESRDPVEQLEERMKPDRRRLDLRQAPLVRLQVAATAGGLRYVLLHTHHLVFDNESLHTMLAEVVACIAGRARYLPQPVGYRQHVAQVLGHIREHDSEAFFRKKLADIEEPTAPYGVLDLHGDGSQIEDAQEALDSQLASRVRARARALGVGAATLFHAAWGLVVSATSGRDDVVYGTVLLGRLDGSAGSERTLGMFINTLPLRLTLREVSARALIEQTQQGLGELLNHEQASLAVAQRCSGLLGAAPLFTALLSYRHGVEDLEPEFAREAGVKFLASVGGTNYPVMISVVDQGEGFLLDVETDRRIDARRVLRYMGTAVASLIDALENSPQTSALTIDVVPQEERTQGLRKFNATEVGYPQERLIHELFEEQVAATPDAIAVSCEADELTYGALNARADCLARHLRALGIGPDRFVGICLERTLDLVVALLGVLKAGGAYVPLDPAYPEERLAYMLEDSAPDVVLIHERLRERLPKTSARVVALDSVWQQIAQQAPDGSANGTPAVRPEHLAYLIYTSGSTGRPKGVAIEHRSTVNLVLWARHALDRRMFERTVLSTSLNFDLAVYECFVPLSTGGCVRVLPNALALVKEPTGITLVNTVPSAMKAVLDLGTLPQTVRVVNLAGEPLKKELAQLIFARTKVEHICNLYGPSETTTYSTAVAMSREEGFNSSIGRPIANTQVYILDAWRRIVPLGVTGEIHIGGRGVARGYLNQPELTRERFLPDPFSADPHARIYKTGDLGRWRANGEIEYLGRNDHQVKIRGFRIELGEIEAKLSQHESVKESVVIAREDASGDKRLVAYVIPRDSNPESEAFRKYLKTTLPEHMVPSAFVMLDAFPMTPNGKLDRRALPPLDISAYHTGEYEAPQGRTEALLAEIWESVLAVKRIGRRQNFFELGGHSLIGMKVIAKTAERFGVSLSPMSIFRHPTIVDLADAIEELNLPSMGGERQEAEYEEGAV